VSREALDRLRLQQALDLAHDAIGVSEPNPRVGCVIGTEDGRVFGVGSTQQAGGPHAEAVALRAAANAGHALRGATAWVTLEPCAHYGRTPPCCDALVAEGLARVVVAVADPFPGVCGEGIARLRAAGIQVDAAPDDLAAAAWDLNVGFFSRMLRQRPWVRLKVATTLDGRTGLENGLSQWITGADARSDGHAWRRRASAVLTGIGTVLADDPQLDVRLVPSNWQPTRVVVDSGLRMPDSARLLSRPGQVLVVAAGADGERRAALQGRGVEVLNLPIRTAAGGRPAVDLCALLATLAARGVNELHVEAGPRLNASLLMANLVDELLVYVAASLVGPGQGMVAWPPLQTLASRSQWVFKSATPVGDDLRLILRPRDAAFGLFSARLTVSENFTRPRPPESGEST